MTRTKSVARKLLLGINSCMRQIRVALNDDAEHPRFVETVPRRGYCFIAPTLMYRL